MFTGEPFIEPAFGERHAEDRKDEEEERDTDDGEEEALGNSKGMCTVRYVLSVVTGDIVRSTKTPLNKKTPFLGYLCIYDP